MFMAKSTHWLCLKICLSVCLTMLYFFPINTSALSPKLPTTNTYVPPLEHDALIDLARTLQHELGTSAAQHRVAKIVTRPSFLHTYTNKNQVVDLQSGLQAENPYWHIRWNPHNGTPASIDDWTPAPSAKPTADLDPTELALAEITRHKTLFQLHNPQRELHVIEQVQDPSGKYHIKLQQYFQEVPIWGHELTVHLDMRGLYAFNAHYAPTPTQLTSITPHLTASQAITMAQNHLTTQQVIAPITPTFKEWLQYTGPLANLYIWFETSTQTPHLAWHIMIRPNWRDRWVYFVDAHTGKILEYYNNTHTQQAVIASGTDLNGIEQTLQVLSFNDTFFMIDASRPIFQTIQPNIIKDPRGVILTADMRNTDLDNNPNLFHVTSLDNNWNDPVAVSAHSNTGRVFEYFFNVHGRRSLDNQDGTILAIIHVTQDGLPMDNAFWNGRLIAYGDGRQAFRPLAGALDVAGHEMTHGVIERTVNLEYRFQSGALNESLADVFGVMIDRDDWQLGEDIAQADFFPSKALRDMADPHNGGSSNDSFWQPAHMDEFRQLPITQDNGGVHINSGIPNHACFLLAQAIGREKTEQIYYRVLDARYLNSRSNFVDMRQAVHRAASEFFGAESPEVTAVNNAFDAVGIIGTEGLEIPATIAPVEGEQWIAVVNAEPTDQSLFLVRPTVESAEDIQRLTTTQIFTQTGNPVSITKNGELILFIDSDNFIRRINSDGSGERVISNQGVWRSIALSPDGTKLAANTIGQDSTIFIFDTEKPEQPKIIRLYSPTTQEDVRAFIVRFADVMDWDSQGRFLIYDAYNTISQGEDLTVAYWDMHVLDVENEIIFPLFQALPDGISIGNPSFAQTSDNIITFDLINANEDQAEIWTANLFTGRSNRIETNGNSNAIGAPHFSSDDGLLVFQRPINNISTLRQIPLAANRLQAITPSQPYLTTSQRPTWFTIGQRQPTAITKTYNTQPSTFQLSQNHPNPFNPTTTISYSLEHNTNISINIYDLRGTLVQQLANGFKTAGRYTVQWDGCDTAGRRAASGVYLYQLSTDTPTAQQLSRKMVLLR